MSFDEEDEDESSFPRTFQSKSIFALAKEQAASLSDYIPQRELILSISLSNVLNIILVNV